MKPLEHVSVALVDAAELIIRNEGHEALRIRDLATAAECSIGMVYKAFKDMDGVIYAVKARVLDQLEAVVSKAVDGRRKPRISPALELATMAEAYLDFAIVEEQRWRALFQHRPQGEKSPPEWYQDHLRKIMGRIDLPMARAFPKLDPAKVHELSGILFAAVHGVVALGVQEKLGPVTHDDMKAQLGILVRAFMAGRPGRQ